MKKIILYVFVSVIFMSCKKPIESINKIDSIKESAETALKYKLNDPKSYEFISLDDNFENYDLMKYESLKKFQLDSVKKYREHIESFNDFVEDKFNIKNDNILISLKCRSTNSFNALVKSEYVVICDKDSIFKEIKDLN